MNIVTVTGYTCSGKSTLEKALNAKGFKSIISTTTRQPRAGEVDGVHYRFVSKDYFLDSLIGEEFIEHVDFDSNYYGVHKDDVPANAENIVIVCEPVGAAQIRRYFKDSINLVCSVFINCSKELAITRLLKRDGMSDEAKAKRLLTMMDVEFKWKNQTLGYWLLPANVSTEEQVYTIVDQWLPAISNPTITCA